MPYFVKNNKIQKDFSSQNDGKETKRKHKKSNKWY